MEEPGGLQPMGSLRVRHDWATSLSLFTFMHWRKKWQPTPVFLPGEFHGQRSLVGSSPWGCKELDMIEHTHKHRGACIFLNYNFVQIYALGWDFRIIWQIYFSFFSTLHTVLHSGCTNFHSHLPSCSDWMVTASSPILSLPGPLSGRNGDPLASNSHQYEMLWQWFWSLNTASSSGCGPAWGGLCRWLFQNLCL